MKDIHVMIVDDDADDRAFLKGAFARQVRGVRFTEVACGQEAMDLLQQLQYRHIQPLDYPQLIFMDLHMPGKDGCEILNELKKNPALSHIPVMILSSSILERERQRCIQAGCDYFFVKPMSLEAYDKIAASAVRFLSAAAEPIL